MGQFIRVKQLMIKDKDGEDNRMLMDRFMKGIGRMIWQMVEEN